MADISPVDFIKPVPPGISWTDAPRSRPWTNPPKIVSLNEIAQGYIDNLSNPAAINGALGAIETGIPLAALANALMLSSVANGTHTIDAGVLVIPVIIEMLVTLAEIHGVDYQVFEKDPTADIVPDRVIRNAMKKASAVSEQEEEVAPVVELSGLMTRKNKMENV